MFQNRHTPPAWLAEDRDRGGVCGWDWTENFPRQKVAAGLSGLPTGFSIVTSSAAGPGQQGYRIATPRISTYCAGSVHFGGYRQILCVTSGLPRNKRANVCDLLVRTDESLR